MGTPGSGPIRTAADAHALARELVKWVNGPQAVAVLDANRRVVDVRATTDPPRPGHTVLVASPNADRPDELPAELLDWLVVGDDGVTSLLGRESPWPPPDPRAEIEEQFFAALLGQLDADGLLTPTDCRAFVLRVEGDADDPRSWAAGVLDVGEGPVRELLLGFDAPSEWVAVGTLTTGWAGAYDGDLARGRMARRPSADPEGRRVAAAMMVGRHGGESSRLRIAGREVITAPGPSEGVVPDALRRALGRPTPPPQATTDELFAAWWLDAVLATARRSRLRWPAVAARHPAAKLLGIEIGPDALVEAASALGRVVGWDQLRLSDATQPELAPWMDAGMYSRWMLGATAPLAPRLVEVRSALGDGVARRTRSLLRALDIVV